MIDVTTEAEPQGWTTANWNVSLIRLHTLQPRKAQGRDNAYWHFAPGATVNCTTLSASACCIEGKTGVLKHGNLHQFCLLLGAVLKYLQAF